MGGTDDREMGTGMGGGRLHPPEGPGGRTHERPVQRRHELPGTIPVSAYRTYRHGGRWQGETEPLLGAGDRALLVTDEWLSYAVDVRESGPHDVVLRVAAADGFGGGRVGFVVDGEPRCQLDFGATGGWNGWDAVGTRLELPRGCQTLRIVVLDGGWKLDRLRIR